MSEAGQERWLLLITWLGGAGGVVGTARSSERHSDRSLECAVVMVVERKQSILVTE